jgi:ligand-binding SRPBCC domain-containing protein
MTTIKLITKINAPIQLVFDLNRNIDIHKLSTSKSKEIAMDGVTSGLINKGETVTWRGKHFGFYLKHKSVIPEMEYPNYFVDEMLEGHFKKFRHHHCFVQEGLNTIVTDTIEYQTPFWIFGKTFDQLILKNYLTRFIKERNNYIKKVAENQ